MTLARRWRALSLVLGSSALVVELPARPERLDEALAARDAETLLEVDWPPALSYEDRGAAAVDRFLAPRPDWAVMSEPWTGGRLALARRVDAPLAPLMEKFAAEWRARQWSPATCVTAGLIANSAPSVLGPVAHAWADELLDAWKRGLALVPRSLKGWGYGMADGSAGALCGGTSGDAPFDPGNRWSCVFLPMTACDEDREYYKDEDRQMRHGFKGAEPVRCSPRLDRRCAAAEFGTPPTPSTFAGRFDAFRGAVAALPESARRGAGDQALVRALAMATLFRPSFRLRRLTRAFDASAFEDGPDACGLVQLRHHARVNLEARGARFAAASFFVDLEDALRDVLPLLRLDTDAPPVLHLLSDDGDMVDDAAKVARARHTRGRARAERFDGGRDRVAG
ncbi:hypothetical protein SO694_00132017 [Aureococcus anophagefferens]|uniref:Uncharacterized protein n=1 Tax=Aureococcus anophagefferens TaxID=44056 RepID=A0ABR1GG05_AURAN